MSAGPVPGERGEHAKGGRHPRWAPGGWSADREAFRTDYGDDVAAVVDLHAERFETRVRRPTAEDIRRTLRDIAAHPAGAGRRTIDSLTRSLLLDAAWRNLRVRALEELTAEQWNDCANHALDRFPLRDDPWIEQAQVAMTVALIGAAGHWHAVRRNALLRVALQSVFAVGDNRSSRIIRKARTALRARGAA